MKILISFLTTVFIATITFAQEESASPAAEATVPAAEEKASATVEETPAAKAAESVAPAMEAKAEATASPKAAAATAAEKKGTTATAATATTATKAAPAAAPMNMKGMAPKELENAWEAAVGSHNIGAVEGMVAADFVGVSSKGKFENRSQMLSEFKGDKDTYKSAKNEKLNVKMYGTNVAVVTGRAREIGAGKDGKAFDRTYLFTDTWMMRGGKWQCIASQISKIKG